METCMWVNLVPFKSSFQGIGGKCQRIRNDSEFLWAAGVQCLGRMMVAATTQFLVSTHFLCIVLQG